MQRRQGRLLLIASLLAAGCTGEIMDPGQPDPGNPAGATGPGQEARPGGSSGAPAPPGARPGSPAQPDSAGQPPAATLRRLTLSQYRNSLRDLLGVTPDVTGLSAVPPLNGMSAIGASAVALPERDIETFETLADTSCAQLFGDSAKRRALTGCDAQQSACAEGFVGSFGRRVFRRPLSDPERARYLGLLASARQLSGDGWTALRAVSQALLQSPSFLYRAELGVAEPGDPSRRRLSDYELASRLSFFLWNSTPDPALLDAAESGELASASGLSNQVARLLASARAGEAIDDLFGDYLQLEALDSLIKLPEIYPATSATLAESMKQETLRSLREQLFERADDFRNVFTSTSTFVNAELAKLYGLRAPSGSGFAPIELPANGPRAGLLMQASFLALHAHPGRSSPTLRGKFIRENLLCQAIPPPPDNVDTSVPATARDAMTARQRLTRHREDPSCAGCHALMDPLGLALEHFDGIGAYRETDTGLAIDASGELEAQRFADARGLASALQKNPNSVSCFVRTVLRYARGALEDASESGLIDALSADFASAGYRTPELLRQITTSPVFRQVGALP